MVAGDKIFLTQNPKPDRLLTMKSKKTAKTKLNDCIFLIGWMSGSDGAEGEENGLKDHSDLRKLYTQKSNVVSAFKYMAPKGFEWEVGASKAFEENFTAHDTFSDVIINGK